MFGFFEYLGLGFEELIDKFEDWRTACKMAFSLDLSFGLDSSKKLWQIGYFEVLVRLIASSYRVVTFDSFRNVRRVADFHEFLSKLDLLVAILSGRSVDIANHFSYGMAQN